MEWTKNLHLHIAVIDNMVNAANSLCSCYAGHGLPLLCFDCGGLCFESSLFPLISSTDKTL
jgi:hypothetical protein